MKAYQLRPGAGVSELRLADIPRPTPDAHEVLIKTHATSLNYRDLMYARGDYINLKEAPLVPLGDGAGEVVAVGSGVTRFQPGDRVTHSYFPGWIDGIPDPRKTAVSFGTHINGALAEYMTVREDAVVPIPSYLSYAEAATLSCAGTTAWNTLFTDGGLEPGATVLLQGTGGLSVFTLQLARAAGLRVIITSSSDEKLARARELGAHETINYSKTPEWQNAVLKLTDARGVDLTVEVGGAGTLRRSVDATRMGGTVSVIGGVTGFGDTPLAPFDLIRGIKRLSGIMVGSRAMLEDLGRFLNVVEMHPFVDREFSFDEAPLAYQYLLSGRHFGKIVIRVAG
jgi:NADPH:quinone reductase-like Zn-dependent oxidoreductase